VGRGGKRKSQNNAKASDGSCLLAWPFGRYVIFFYNLVTNILAKNNLTVKGREYLLNMYIIKDNIANAAVT
jgi:hypothetical protein